MSTYSRSVWSEQFNTPTIATLRGALDDQAIQLFDQALAMFQGLDEIVDSIRWYGDCWHWTLGYLLDEQNLKDPSEDWEPLALIIPAPEDVQLAMALTPEFVASINTRRLKRGVREGLELGCPPFTTRWGVWSIPTPGLMAELAGLMKQKVAWMRTH